MVSGDASRWLAWTFFRPVVHVKVAVGSDTSNGDGGDDASRW